MFDATGQEESGKASGNLVSEGQYEQCRDVRQYTDDDDTVQAQYCLTWWYGAPVRLCKFMYMYMYEYVVLHL